MPNKRQAASESRVGLTDLLAITMTGVDARTDLCALPEGIEVGVLFTATPEGRHRYPERREAVRLLGELEGRRIALHVCGQRAREALIVGALTDLTSRVQRLQVNGRVAASELQQICRQYPQHAVITQHAAANFGLLSVDVENHAVLVDESGGRGISPAAWARPSTPKSVGFAGGLGQDNIVGEIARIRAVAVADDDWWIDMEGKLRDADDWFDVGRARDLMAYLNG